MTEPNPEVTEAIGRFLEQRALLSAGQALVFYGDIVAMFGLPTLDGAWLSHPLCGIFGVLDLEDHRLNRPLRTALVVNRETRMPGNGFFETAQHLGRLEAHLSDEIACAIFWGRECERLLQYWQRKRK